MTDTELILSKIEDLRTELKGDMRDLRTELKGDMQNLRTELGGKIAAVQIAVGDLRERMDVMEFGLQTEIEKTYDLALENAENIRILMAEREKNHQRRTKIRLITDYKK